MKIILVRHGEADSDGFYEECDGEADCAEDCTWIKDLYWTWTNNTVIEGELTIDALDLIGKQFKMWIERPDSDNTFDLWEYDAFSSNDEIDSFTGTSSGNNLYSTWTLSNADFTKTDDETGDTYKFYFLIDGETSRDYLPEGQLQIKVINGHLRVLMEFIMEMKMKVK